MSLSGIHVACASVGTVGSQPMLTKPYWSHTLSAAGTTFQAAPHNYGGLTFEVSASIDAWVSWGANPDPSQGSAVGDGARIFVAAGTTRNIRCSPGDKLAWAAA